MNAEFHVVTLSCTQNGLYTKSSYEAKYSSFPNGSRVPLKARRCFESGSVMNNAFTLPVRSQEGWANMGQHLEHKLGKVE